MPTPLTRPTRRTEELHKGRLSLPGARYFVTLVTQNRTPWLQAPAHAASTLAALRAWHTEGDGAVLAATVMPDHVHVLFELGHKLTTGQCIARWKSTVRRSVTFSETWQRDFWEHRLRPDELAEDYALYIYLNPYRARLIPATATWASWWLPDPRLVRFARALNPHGTPPSAWIDWPDERFSHLAIGE